MPKKIQSGESFLQKFPTSVYRSYVYATLTVGYFSTNQPDKAMSAGEKVLELDPQDIRTMGVLSQALARLYNPSQPNADTLLAKAEQYGNKAIELSPTLKKPAAASQEAFDANKNEALAMAHSGLGLVNIRKGKTAEAIQDLDQATKLDHDRDPANLYLLGFANQNAGHFVEAAAAFHRCAAISGNMQDTCKKGEAEAQKRAAPQLK
jgi:tetratricopeptide (TPR) repeat protein